jgi:hypothetical protein
VSPLALESKTYNGEFSFIFIIHILESVPQEAKCKLSGAHVKSVIPIYKNY